MPEVVLVNLGAKLYGLYTLARTETDEPKKSFGA